MVLPIIALIVASLSLFFTIKVNRETKRKIESGQEFIEWRKKMKKG